MVKTKQDTESIFTKIIKGEIPTTRRYEDDDFIVINDIHPIAPVHVLIITKEPYPSLEAVPETNRDFHAELLLLARKMAKQLGIADNYKLFMNVGEHVQQVQHLHLHLYGGWKNKRRKEMDAESMELINQ